LFSFRLLEVLNAAGVPESDGRGCCQTAAGAVVGRKRECVIAITVVQMAVYGNQPQNEIRIGKSSIGCYPATEFINGSEHSVKPGGYTMSFFLNIGPLQSM
jgi:hypothetical protein